MIRLGERAYYNSLNDIITEMNRFHRSYAIRLFVCLSVRAILNFDVFRPIYFKVEHTGYSGKVLHLQ